MKQGFAATPMGTVFCFHHGIVCTVYRKSSDERWNLKRTWLKDDNIAVPAAHSNLIAISPFFGRHTTLIGKPEGKTYA